MSRRHLVAAARTLAVALLVLPGAVQPGATEELVTAVSSDTVSIESNFTGAEIVLFGSIERDQATIARRSGYDIVVVTRGPARRVTAWRKERIAGIWVNTRSRTFINAPGYLAVMSNRPLPDIADERVLARYQLGLDRLTLLQPGTGAGLAAQEGPFREAVVRLMGQRNLYVSDHNGVRFLSPSLFLSRIPLPATVPVGLYQSEIYLFGDGALLQRSTVEITIRKSGFEQAVTTLADDHALIYGLGAVAIAFFAGWLAGVIFRRE